MNVTKIRENFDLFDTFDTIDNLIEVVEKKHIFIQRNYSRQGVSDGRSSEKLWFGTV